MSAAKSGLQRLIQGTPIERPSRALWRRVHPPAPRTPNQLLNDVYDGLTYEIIRRILPRDGCAVDVGCHVGKVLEEILHAAPDGEHHAFEPLPHLAERLRHEFPSVAIHEVALSDHAGTSTFQYAVEYPAYSGLHRRRYPGEATVQEITVELAWLDDVLPAGQRVDFLKIDVEGGELDVLRGAERIVVESQPVVVFEWGDRAAAPYGASKVDVHRFFSHCGLVLSHLQAFVDGGPPMDEAEFLNTTGFMFVGHAPSR